MKTSFELDFSHKTGDFFSKTMWIKIRECPHLNLGTSSSGKFSQFLSWYFFKTSKQKEDGVWLIVGSKNIHIWKQVFTLLSFEDLLENLYEFLIRIKSAVFF